MCDVYAVRERGALRVELPRVGAPAARPSASPAARPEPPLGHGRLGLHTGRAPQQTLPRESLQSVVRHRLQLNSQIHQLFYNLRLI